ncbi:hypothetical protein PGIGA_G00181380 [Pangasianodon gigas]|uniref:Uncharacterized protein n=1 Tax=Pangasianodon gigas TaxID=30993 RepID=A0ACC5XWU7_PANGG|nr:hypothetical protein [Pangasianodon gigas]
MVYLYGQLNELWQKMFSCVMIYPGLILLSDKLYSITTHRRHRRWTRILFMERESLGLLGKFRESVRTVRLREMTQRKNGYLVQELNHKMMRARRKLERKCTVQRKQTDFQMNSCWKEEQ